MRAAVAHDPKGTKTPCELELVNMCNAVHNRCPTQMAAARSALMIAFGGDGAKLADTIGIISFFNGIADRIADATGLRVEPMRMSHSVQFADANLIHTSSSPIAQGIWVAPKSITVAGFASCPFHQDAISTAKSLATMGLVGDVEELTFETRDSYREWLFGTDGRQRFTTSSPSVSTRALRHTSSPFVWQNDGEFVGGCDDLKMLASQLKLVNSSASPRQISSKL